MTQEQKNLIKEHFEMMGVQCISDNPITEEDINDLRSRKTPTGDGAPCFLACVMKKIGVVRKLLHIQLFFGLKAQFH